jgi:nicotinamidase-related amidase
VTELTLLPLDAVLLVIDVQQAFDDPSWGLRNNPSAEANIAALIAGWRKTQRPIVHIQHHSLLPESVLHPSHPGVKVKPEAEPLAGEPVIYKSVNSAFIGTDLEQRLRDMGAKTLVIVGITTDHCVSTSTRMAANLGFANYIVSDATATFERVGPDGKRYSAELMHETALTSLHREFATVIDTASVLAAV